MIAAGSLIGFFLVFVATTWSLSIVATGAHWLARPRLQSWGPAAEKRAALLATVSPIALGALVTATVAAYSAFPGIVGGADHCGAHGHHIHLCLFHGGEWASTLWAVVASAAIGGLIAAGAARLASKLFAGRRRVGIIESSSRPALHQGVAVFVAPSTRDFCFAAGYRRPRIYVASVLWHRLDASQRDAIIAHELAHIDNRDLWQSLLLSVVEIVGAPLVTRRARLAWDRATERLCDRIAADHVGDDITVAEALLSWARAPRLAGLSFSPGSDALEERVAAVLSDQPAGDDAATRIARLFGALLTASAITLVALADPLHHALETILGLGAGL